MATTKHRQSSISTQEDDTNLYSDVDEIFTKLDISQIHQLNKKYRNIIDDTKSNLHDLVGSKYRDLIKIAEDIGDIYQHSSDIDLKVQQLSYKPTKFISIYSDNYGKFDSYMRKQNALQSQKDSLHTSNFIYYAKVYHTIEKAFSDIIEKDNNINEKYYELKRNFKNYLEYEISAYNLPESILHANDKFKFNQRLNSKELIMNNPQVLLQDDLDLEFEEEDIEAEEEQDDTDEARNSENAFEVDESSILNSKSKFIELRFLFLQNLFKQLDNESQIDHINFYQIFKYLEHTFVYFDNHFDRKTSDYHRLLLHVTKPWNATTLIGHRVWVEDKLIEFDHATSETSFDKVHKFTEMSNLLLQFVLNILPQENTFENLSLTIFIFHNFLVSLKKLQDSLEISGMDSKFIQLISQTSLLFDLLTKVSSFMNSLYLRHVSYLTEESGLSSIIRKKLELDTHNKEVFQLFTPEFVNLMDHDIDKYINIISKYQESQTTGDAISSLNAWFDKCGKYLKIVNPDSKNISISKLDQITQFVDFMSNAHAELKSPEKLVYVSELSINLNKLIESVPSDDFYLLVDESIQESVTIETVDIPVRPTLKLVRALYKLSSNYLSVAQNSNNSNIFLEAQVTEDFIKCKNKWVEKNLIGEVFLNGIEKSIKKKKEKSLKSTAVDGKESPDRALEKETTQSDSAKIKTKEENEAEQTTKEKSEKESKEKTEDDGVIKTDEANVNSLDQAEEKIDEPQSESKEKEPESNEEDDDNGKTEIVNGTTSITKTQALSIIANYTFLLHFLNSKVDLEDIESVTQLIKTHYGADIETSSIKIVIDGVGSFYKSQKSVYLPLSIIN
ncbi:Vps51/Vps67 family protein [Candida albicans]|uniref:Conserved oligomeric Golgi complex subunit 1 n=1 Tax=Candida albicans TaxID=5476 RepID=A0A8H6BV30_CANAX|nr:Vps51/Vps67 family protein [Candida albicans]